MVTFLLPHSQTLEIVECPKRPTLSSEEESPRISFRRTSSKSPERVHHRTGSEGKVPRDKPQSRNSWLRTITISLMSGSGTLRSEPAPSPPLHTPTHVRRRTRSLIDFVFAPQGVDAEDPRLPDHMRRPELQLRRIQRRDLPPSRSSSTRSSSVERNQKHAPWWAT